MVAAALTAAAADRATLSATAGAAPASWQALAPLKLALSCNARLYEHSYRGSRWTIIEDRSQGHYFRCPAAAGDLLRRLDGRTSLAAVIRQLSPPGGDPAAGAAASGAAASGAAASGAGAAMAEDAVDTAAIAGLLIQLLQAGLLQGELPVAHGAQLARWERQRQVQRRQQWLRPLMIRIPLWDPDRLLARVAPRLRLLFTPAAALACAAVIALALLQCAQQWTALQWYWSARFLDHDNLMLLLLLYPLLKGLHELGHGIATRHWGGSVHETGIMLLVFMPLPYVDASASSAFVDKRQRMVVASAGILVELMVAATALLLWGQLSHGLARDIAFDLALLGGASSLLFNGNPLLRFDGYYVLSDWLEIPNLGPRSARYLGYLCRRYAVGLRHAVSPATAAGEAPWFLVYGIAAGVYRLVISFGIALYVAGKYFVAGLLLGAWGLLHQLLWPAARNLLSLIRAARSEGRLARLAGVTLLLLSTLISVLLFVPVTSSTRAQGLVIPAGEAYVRAGAEGFLAQLHVVNGASVSAGTALLRLENPDLATEMTILEARRIELETRLGDSLLSDPLAAANLQASLLQLQSEIDEHARQLDGLTVFSAVDGRFFTESPADRLGRFYAKGDQLGWVIPTAPARATIALPVTRAASLNGTLQRIEVRLHSRPGRVFEARLLQQQPAATDLLPHAGLGSAGGGAIPVDRTDGERLHTMAPVFLYDIELPAQAGAMSAGARLTVRFVHDGQPLARLIGDRLRQKLQERLKI